MTILQWIFGVGFLILFPILLFVALVIKKLLKFHRICLVTVSIIVLLIAIPVIAVDYISEDTFMIIVITDIYLILILIYISSIISLKALNFYLWKIPYDNEKEKVKLKAQKEAFEKIVFGFPFYFGLMIFFFIMAAISSFFK
ncbi:hypothetical protein [Chengkuizengella sediminis]|uniref:hypothetical protein n=1 Tax=Chengkuizengella sediminis TaxID=1885917 RepID=UPI00138A3AA9|nr:hypothetical protein [Chengkuizengella sediminis]NDI35744.1 hypothetical protein [Chengkuizengella sediminis]